MRNVQPQHYKEGPCKGKQFTRHPHLKKAKKVAVVGLAGTAIVGGGLICLAVAVPTACVALPLYGGYRLVRNVLE